MKKTAGKIFISYRQADSRADAGRLYDRLNGRYPNRVFRDIATIAPGSDWKQTIDTVLRSSAACVVVIGPHWRIRAVAPDGASTTQTTWCALKSPERSNAMLRYFLS